MKWVIFAFRNLFRNARRSFITLAITATGVSSILCSSGFAMYTYHILETNSALDSGHVILSDPSYFTQDEDQPLALGLDNYQDLRAQLQQDPKVLAALPRVAFSGLISNGDKSVIFSGNGVEAEEWEIKQGAFRLLQGKSLSATIDLEKDAEVMLTRDLARNLKAELNSSLTLLVTASSGSLNAIDVQVVGIFATGIPELDKRLLMVHNTTAQELLLNDKISTLAVYLQATSQTDAMVAQVRQQYPDLGVRTWLEEAVFYRKVLDLYNRIFGTLGMIITLIVFFAVFNTLSMTVVERTREIGTLAALGTYRHEILRLFMLEALIIGVMGSVFGILSTLGIAQVVEVLGMQMPAPPGRNEPYPFIIEFSLSLSVYTCVAITVVCVLGAWLAARRGVNKTIVEALADV